MKISLNDAPVIGITGHVGCGHAHSHCGYTQDDSGGFAVALNLFEEATGIDFRIESVETEPGTGGKVTVTTKSGGVASAGAARGFTPFEAELMRGLKNRDIKLTHALTAQTFGRLYGQGVTEAPVALQSALANAAIDSLEKNFPGDFYFAEEGIAGNFGRIAGTVMDFDGVPVSVMAVVNATWGGLGPVEDLEGNVAAGGKKTVSGKLGMEGLPTIIVEGKVYAAMFSDDAPDEYFLVRADDTDDNPFVAGAIVSACDYLGYPVKYRKDVTKRVKGALEKSTRDLADKIMAEAEKLENARFAQEKAHALSNLSKLVSEDGAGISFMSDRLHEIVGGTGMLPGTGSVLSLIVPKSHKDKNVVLTLTRDDLDKMTAIVKQGVKELYKRLPEARKHLEQHSRKDSLENLILKQASA